MRTAFVDGLIDLAKIDERILLIVGDLGYSVVEKFQKEFPKRFVNAGVSEQAMMGIAAGIASEGGRPFAYSIANFPTFRCAEQIRNDIAYHNLGVTVVSVGGGLVYGNMGYSHHAIQDYALMRVMPGMAILAPGDPLEVRMCLEFALVENRPAYLRLGNPNTPEFHPNPPSAAGGEWVLVAGSPESKNALLATGGALSSAIKFSRAREYSEFAVYSLPIWGMPFRDMQAEWVGKFDTVVTVEDHLIDGGFGSWLMESLSKTKPELLKRLTILSLDPRVTETVGDESSLRELGGI
jgi:transketolase